METCSTLSTSLRQELDKHRKTHSLQLNQLQEEMNEANNASQNLKKTVDFLEAEVTTTQKFLFSLHSLQQPLFLRFVRFILSSIIYL